MSVSKALENTTNYSTRWETKRVERRLDDRDNLLSEALYNLENRTVTLTGAATGTGVVDSSGDLSIAVTLAGSTFPSLTCNGVLDVNDSATISGNLTFDGATDQTVRGPTGANLSIMTGAMDQGLILGVTDIGNMVEIDGPNMAFFAASPVAQPSTTGEVTGVTAGSGTPLTHEATFTGGVGSTAYTISDIVKHLKNLGLLAQ